MLNSLSKKVAGLNPCNFIKKRLQHICFPVNIAKFLRTPILKNICDRLLLNLSSQSLLIIIYYKINQFNTRYDFQTFDEWKRTYKELTYLQQSQICVKNLEICIRGIYKLYKLFSENILAVNFFVLWILLTQIIIYSENDCAKFWKAEIGKSNCCKNIPKLAYNFF